MKNLRFFDSSLNRNSLSNLKPYLRNGCDLTDVLDAVEDALNPDDLPKALERVLPAACFVLDRAKPGYVRVKFSDRSGNVFYLLADIDNGWEGYNVYSI